MKSAIWTLVLWTLVNRFMNASAKVSLTDLITCQEYSIKSGTGYGYHKYFDVNKLNVADASDGDELLRLNFFVQAAKDAHIILANTNAPNATDKGYEIAIGAGNNAFSFIRMKFGLALSKKNMRNAISASNPTQIEIIQTRGNGTEGKLTVNLVGLDEPHLEWTDSDRLEIKYVGFSSYGKTNASWYYDCKKVLRLQSKESDFESNLLKDRKLPDDIRLIKHLSPNRKMPPAELKNIKLDFVLKSVDAYDANYAILSTRSGLSMTWIDPRLQWNPSDYGNLTFFKSYIFWTPKLRVDNGVGASLKAIPGHFQSTIYHNGTVTASNPDAQIDSACMGTKQGWPHKGIECRIEISVANSKAGLDYDGNSTVLPTLQDFDMQGLSVELDEDLYVVKLTFKPKHV